MHGLIAIWITRTKEHGKNKRKMKLGTSFHTHLWRKLNITVKLNHTLKNITKKRMHGIILS